MTDTVETMLAHVYNLIESNDLEQAQVVLKTLLDTDRDNPDVWWLYAHSVTEPETARMALNSVLHLDPGYPQVKELLSRLNTQIGDNNADVTTEEPHFIETALPVFPNYVSSNPSSPQLLPGEKHVPPQESSFTGSKTISSKVPVFRQAGFLLMFALVIAALISVFGIIRLLDQQRIVSGVSTVATQPVNTIESIPADRLKSLTDAFSGFIVQSNGIIEEDTALGATLIVRVCTIPGREMRTTLLESMDLLAHQMGAVEGIEALAVQVWDCSTEFLLRYMAVPIAISQSYVGNMIEQQEFEAQWLPVG